MNAMKISYYEFLIILFDTKNLTYNDLQIKLCLDGLNNKNVIKIKVLIKANCNYTSSNTSNNVSYCESEHNSTSYESPLQELNC